MSARIAVLSAYTAKYTDPISFRAGERVTVQRADDEYPGWHWCVGGNGKEGWVHESFLSATTGVALAVRDYTAAELTVTGGEEGRLLDRLSAWAYLELNDGRIGWLPAEVTVVIA